MEINGTLYAAAGNKLWRCSDTGGIMSEHATLAGTGSVYFARNNAAPIPDKVVVTELGAFVIIDPGTINNYPDPDLPVPNSVFSLDGYMVFTVDDGRAFATDLNDTAVNSLSFGQADAKPDGLVRGVAFGGRAFFFGTQTLEIWVDVGATPFPFQRSVVVPFGLIGPDAIAGWEDGWGAGLLWVAQDGTVRILDGYQATKVSSTDLDRLIREETNKARLLASIYMVDGHPMWNLTGTNFTWCYDLETKQWHERQSYLRNHWRGRQTWFAFDKWLIGDRGSPDPGVGGDGDIRILDPTNYMEDADPLRVRVESGPVEQFPQRVRVAQAEFKFETGVGQVSGDDPTQTDPTVEISWSDDGGVNWSIPLLRKLGKQEITGGRIRVFRTGMSTVFGRRWRVDVADPVYVSLMTGDQSAELRK